MAAKTYTRHCAYCDTGYQTTSKPYRGKAPLFSSCSASACITACTDAYNTARAEAIETAAAVRAATPRTSRTKRVAYGEWGMAVMLSNPGLRKAGSK
jgi:hypothetical protein